MCRWFSTYRIKQLEKNGSFYEAASDMSGYWHEDHIVENGEEWAR